MINDVEYMKIALSEARKAYDSDEVPVGAVIVDVDGKILGRGYNLKENACIPILHAEMVAILNVHRAQKRMYLDGCTIYVTLEPCPMCAAALIHERISRIVYSAADNKYGACGSVFNLTDNSAMNHRISVTGGVLKEESSVLLMSFFTKLRR